jgi:hypothetical protein
MSDLRNSKRFWPNSNAELEAGVSAIIWQSCCGGLNAAKSMGLHAAKSWLSSHRKFQKQPLQSVTNTFFLIKYEYQILFGFQKSLNTEYWILFVIEKIRIPNTKYYSESRKFEYRIRIVLFGLTVRIPNTKYRIVYNILEKMKLK